MDEAHLQTDKKLAKIERKLQILYSRAADEAQSRAAKFWDRFKIMDERKRLQVKAGILTKEEYAKWRHNKSEMMRGYYSPLVTVLATDLTHTNEIAASIVRGHLPEVYANNFNYATYQIEHDTRLDTSFTLYDRQTVERLVRDNPDIIPIKPRPDIPKDQVWNKQKINAEITQGILQGDSIPDIAKRLRRVADMNKVAAVRTARTATTAAQNSGRVDSYKRAQSMGIRLGEQWVATLDQVTRASHVDMDGETIPVAKDKWHPTTFSNGCRYPGDPAGPPAEVYNCRCTLIADIEGVDQGKIDDLTLRNNRKLGGMSYEEWKNHKKGTGKTVKVGPKVEPRVTPPARKKALTPRMPRNYDTELATRMVHAIGKDGYDKALDMLEACKNKDVQNAYLKCENMVEVGTLDLAPNKTAYQSMGRIYINAGRVARGDEYKNPFSTYFHECAHAVDYYLMLSWKNDIRDKGQTSSLLLNRYYSVAWQDGRFGTTITNEVEKWVDREHKTLLEEYKESKYDLEWWKYKGLLSSWDAKVIEMQAHSRGRAVEEHLRIMDRQGRLAELGMSKPNKAAAYKVVEEIIRDELRKEGGYRAAGSLSDIVEGATKGKVQPGVGHGKSYWKKIGVEIEAFAEMNEAHVSSLDSLELLRQYLPESVAAFEEMMADATKLIERSRIL